jgi:TRAP-type C4-dicarboxylate transport system permease small subunit
MAQRTRALAVFEARLVSANRWVLIALMAAMAVLVFANVVSRYLLNYSIIWVEELTRYMMVWVGFLGAGLVLRLGAHIALEAFQDLLPSRAARALRAGIVVLLGATFASMTWLGARYAAFAWEQETPVLNWSTGAVYLAIPIGSALLLAHLVFIAKGYVRAREFGKDESFHAEEVVL